MKKPNEIHPTVVPPTSGGKVKRFIVFLKLYIKNDSNTVNDIGIKIEV